MVADHIFIFSKYQGDEADKLIRFGLTEGSSRVHPGQGTRNRKFYFENFFLEIVWVSNEVELTSEITAPTRLWERAHHKINGSSPFGLCLVNSPDTDYLFEESLKYRPAYLPGGMSFDIITNEKMPYLPWICRLPSSAKNIAQEQTIHPVGIKKSTNIKFGIQNPDYQNRFTDIISRASDICFQNAENHSLMLEFDDKRNRKIKRFANIPLIIEY